MRLPDLPSSGFLRWGRRCSFHRRGIVDARGCCSASPGNFQILGLAQSPHRLEVALFRAERSPVTLSLEKFGGAMTAAIGVIRQSSNRPKVLWRASNRPGCSVFETGLLIGHPEVHGSTTGRHSGRIWASAVNLFFSAETKVLKGEKP